jgi:capsid protein
MALSKEARARLESAITRRAAAKEIADAIDASGSPAANVANITSSNLVGVDGTGSNAAPLAGTETRLDAIETKINAILAAMQAAGQML